MADKIISDINGLEPGHIIDLFELDMSTGTAAASQPIFRWHSGQNENLQEIVWQGNRYSAFPIVAEGFEFSGKGAIPRPSLTVANITTLLTSVIESYDDLVGSKVTRKRTFAKYLDAYCYLGGYPSGGV
jgi:lambda family phage minor tail protein L